MSMKEGENPRSRSGACVTFPTVKWPKMMNIQRPFLKGIKSFQTRMIVFLQWNVKEVLMGFVNGVRNGMTEFSL